MFSGDAVNLTPPAFAVDSQSPPTFLKKFWAFFSGLLSNARHLTGIIPVKKDSAIYPSSGSARTIDYLPQGTPEELELGGRAGSGGNLNRKDSVQLTLFERQEQGQRVEFGAPLTASQIVESIESETGRDGRHVGEEVQEITPLSFLVAVSVYVSMLQQLLICGSVPSCNCKPIGRLSSQPEDGDPPPAERGQVPRHDYCRS